MPLGHFCRRKPLILNWFSFVVGKLRLETSGGKSDCRLILIGTKAPGIDGGWWRNLIDAGSDAGTYVQTHAATVDDDGEVPGWSTWRIIGRANPLIPFNPHLRPKLEDELRKARRDEDARRRFLTYRLNAPQQPLRSVLFTVDQWARRRGPRGTCGIWAPRGRR